MKTNIPEFNFTGPQLAEAGLSVAVENAERNDPGWKERVWDEFVEWLKSKPAGFQFMMEDFRETVETEAIGQAFGFIPIRAKKDNLIGYFGMAKTKKPISHGRPGYVWFKK